MTEYEFLMQIAAVGNYHPRDAVDAGAAWMICDILKHNKFNAMFLDPIIDEYNKSNDK